MSQEPRPITITVTPDMALSLWRKVSWMAKSTGDPAWGVVAAELQSCYVPMAIPDRTPRVATDEPVFSLEHHWRSP